MMAQVQARNGFHIFLGELPFTYRKVLGHFVGMQGHWHGRHSPLHVPPQDHLSADMHNQLSKPDQSKTRKIKAPPHLGRVALVLGRELHQYWIREHMRLGGPNKLPIPQRTISLELNAIHLGKPVNQ